MSDKSREAIRSNLERALAPPSRRSRSLDGLLDEYAPSESVGPATVSGPTAVNGPANVSQPTASQPTVGQPSADRQPIEPPTASPMDRRSTVDRQPAVGNLIASLPDVAGHTELPHRYSDHLAPLLSPDEQAVYAQLYRLSWGFHSETCFITNPRLSERSNVPLTTMKRVVQKLESKGLIEKVERKFGAHHEQGIVYRVPALDRRSTVGQPTTDHNKIRNKETSKRVAAPPDTKNCPDCQGSGFWYPGGPEKGVAKCKHLALKGNLKPQEG